MSDVKHTAGPYRAIGSAIYADAPQDVDHSHYKGFGEPEPDRGYLIAESIPHKPTRDLLTAAPEMLEALIDARSRLFYSDLQTDIVDAAIAKASGETP